MKHPCRELCVVLRSSLLIAIGCVSLSCRVDDYGNSAYQRDASCPTHLYRGFCVTPDAPVGDASADALVDTGSDQPSDPSSEGEACAHDHDEKLCYDAPDSTRAVGCCISGVSKCVHGRWTECFGQVMPEPETCNGADDDCDGRADEDPHGDCVAPATGCRGQLVCEDGHSVCAATADPMPETCNGLDDDCDGRIDEESDQACVDDNAGCVADGRGGFRCKGTCVPGIQRCEAGVLDATCNGQVKPAAEEHCDADAAGMDDDCDGHADEDCPCKGTGSRPCYAGNAQARETGACVPGSQKCVGGTWGACEGATEASDETCPNDGVDNDCNGDVDDVLGAGKRCVSSRLGNCRSGKQECVGDELRCVTPSEKAETCNAIDDDCDGKTDETFDLKNDHAHCGDCDTACAKQETCCNGSCVDTRTDAKHCNACDMACGSNGLCCDSFCSFPRFDHENCGACGHACATEQVCCDATCVDLQTDANNCGACMQVCETDCIEGNCSAM